jgi:cytochrome P450
MDKLQTAATLTFAIYMLAEHPLIAQRLREEILRKVGNSRRPTYDDVRDMKYLRAFINGKVIGSSLSTDYDGYFHPETIRLYPPV